MKIYFYRITIFICLILIIADIASAQNKLDSLQNLLKKSKEDSNKVNVLQMLCAFYRFSDGKKVKSYAEQSLKLAQKINYPKGEAFAYIELGIMSDLQGDFQAALRFYDTAEPIFVKNKLLRGQAIVKQNRAMLYYYQSDYLKAQQNYLDALRVFEQINERDGQASVLNNLGALFQDKKDYPNALRYTLQALKVKESLGKPASLSSTLGNIGSIYLAMKKIEDAEKYSKQSLENAQQYQNKRSEAIALANLGSIAFERKDYNNALDLHQKSLNIEKERKNEEGVAACWINIGQSLLQLKKTDEAIDYLEKGLKIMEKIDYKFHIQNALQYLAEAHAANKNFEQSYQFQQRYIAIHDSIYTEESNRKIAEMQTLYETEKKDKQISVQNLAIQNQNLTIQNQRNTQYFLFAMAALLMVLALVLWNRYRFKVKTNRILDEKNQELIRLNATKDKLFAIVAHDLKNPLSAFRSITQSLSENVLSISKEEIDYFIKQLNDSASHLFDLLQNLLSWAIAQIGKLPFQPENLTLKNIITENIKLLQVNAHAKQIEIQTEIAEDTAVFADKQMLRAIIRNLLSNAIKFTPENGEIIVSAQQKENLIEIAVEDNGIGIAENDLQKLFKVEADVSKIGDSSEKGTGLGLLLCKELVEKNGGEIAVSSKLGNGSKFYFTLPFSTT